MNSSMACVAAGTDVDPESTDCMTALQNASKLNWSCMTALQPRKWIESQALFMV